MRHLKEWKIVYGETYPYCWAVYRGPVPYVRTLTKGEALRELEKMMGEFDESYA